MKFQANTISKMSRVREKQLSWSFGRWISDVGVLVKWRLTLTVVFSSVMAFAIAAGSEITAVPALILAVGGFLIAGAANAMNQILERDYDKLMSRTKDRPVASNTMPISEAVVIAGIMLLFGVIALALFQSADCLSWGTFIYSIRIHLHAIEAI